MQVYNPGEQLVLGGLGLADFMDTSFLTAFRHEKAGSTAKSLQATSILPKSLRTADLSDYVTWQQALIKSIKRNRMMEVLILIETGDLVPPCLGPIPRSEAPSGS